MQGDIVKHLAGIQGEGEDDDENQADVPGRDPERDAEPEHGPHGLRDHQEPVLIQPVGDDPAASPKSGHGSPAATVTEATRAGEEVSVAASSGSAAKRIPSPKYDTVVGAQYIQNARRSDAATGAFEIIARPL
jgi:hypothetical protein